MKKALVIIDLQNDYFEGGNYPLWNSEKILSNTKEAITIAKNKNIPLILIQHLANPKSGKSLFFNIGTPGIEIHKEIS